MKWLFGFAIAVAMWTPTNLAYAQQSAKAKDKQRPGQQADRTDKARTQAQKGGGGRGGQGGGGLFRLLDTDRDGKLSANEIDGAIAVLMKLDRNRDGILDSDELAKASRGRGGGQRGKGSGRGRTQRTEKRVRNDQ